MTTYEKIKQLCEKEGFSVSSISDHIDGLSVSSASVARWKTSGFKPRPSTLRLIAEHFGKPVSYFCDDPAEPGVYVGGNINTVGGDVNGTFIGGSVGDQTLTDEELTLIELYRVLSPINRAKILVRAEELKTEQEKSTQK